MNEAELEWPLAGGTRGPGKWMANGQEARDGAIERPARTREIGRIQDS